jgi:hypothetical protein
MASNWNAYLDRLREEKLTGNEYRLAITLMREILGYRVTEKRIGRKRLREQSGLDGRTFDRARDGLIHKGLIRYEPGAVGRGNRSLYTLILEPAEKAALERPNLAIGKGRARAATYR